MQFNFANCIIQLFKLCNSIMQIMQFNYANYAINYANIAIQLCQLFSWFMQIMKVNYAN